MWNKATAAPSLVHSARTDRDALPQIQMYAGNSLQGWPHFMQMACVFVMYSATASSCGIGSQATSVVLIQQRRLHAIPVCKFIYYDDKRAIEELPFIDPTTSVPFSIRSMTSAAVRTANRFVSHFGMRHNVLFRITRIDFWFETPEPAGARSSHGASADQLL